MPRSPAARVLLVAALLMALPSHVLGWTDRFEVDGIQGTLAYADGTVHSTARLVLDVPPEKVIKALTDYDHLGDLFSDTAEYRVIKREGTSARFYRKSDTPFFLPSVWVIADAQLLVRPDGTARVDWVAVDGTIKAFRAFYEIAPEGSGTSVVYDTVSKPPFTLPKFLMMKAGAGAMVDTLKGLRKAVAKR